MPVTGAVFEFFLLPENLRKQYIEQVPLKRFGSAADVANDEKVVVIGTIVRDALFGARPLRPRQYG